MKKALNLPYSLCACLCCCSRQNSVSWAHDLRGTVIGVVPNTLAAPERCDVASL